MKRTPENPILNLNQKENLPLSPPSGVQLRWPARGEDQGNQWLKLGTPTGNLKEETGTEPTLQLHYLGSSKKQYRGGFSSADL